MNHHAMSPVGGKRVFLAYGDEDSGFARHLAELLANGGHQPFDVPASASEDGDVSDAILNALRQADTVVFVVPAREGAGKGALEELGAARALGKRIVAVMPDGSRAWNTGIARAISRAPVVDASRIAEDRLVDALALGR